jgi:hypothetical protein
MAAPSLDTARADRSSRLRRRLSADFQALWEKIKHRTRYRVTFETDDLMARAIARIKQIEPIKAPRVSTTVVEVDITDAGVSTDRQIAARVRDTEAVKVLPDILGFLQKESELTRHTLAEILKRESLRVDLELSKPAGRRGLRPSARPAPTWDRPSALIAFLAPTVTRALGCIPTSCVAAAIPLRPCATVLNLLGYSRDQRARVEASHGFGQWVDGAHPRLATSLTRDREMLATPRITWNRYSAGFLIYDRQRRIASAEILADDAQSVLVRHNFTAHEKLCETMLDAAAWLESVEDAGPRLNT